jgi:hypothetical protein
MVEKKPSVDMNMQKKKINEINYWISKFYTSQRAQWMPNSETGISGLT